jgi:hypothetical protein
MNPLLRKMMLKPGHRVILLGAPAEYRSLLTGEKELTVTEKGGKGLDAALLFARGAGILRQLAGEALSAIRPDGLLWISYPKKSSGLQTDLTMQEGWEPLHEVGYRVVSLVSLDETWSAGRWRKQETFRSSRSERVRSQPEINGHIDMVRRTVILPGDLQKALAKSAKAGGLFDGLSFTCRKEYVKWILEAKNGETRKRRVEGAVKLLLKGAKTPFGPK